jgi:hypothetical protein
MFNSGKTTTHRKLESCRNEEPRGARVSPVRVLRTARSFFAIGAQYASELMTSPPLRVDKA